MTVLKTFVIVHSPPPKAKLQHFSSILYANSWSLLQVCLEPYVFSVSFSYWERAFCLWYFLTAEQQNKKFSKPSKIQTYLCITLLFFTDLHSPACSLKEDFLVLLPSSGCRSLDLWEQFAKAASAFSNGGQASDSFLYVLSKSMPNFRGFSIK